MNSFTSATRRKACHLAGFVPDWSHSNALVSSPPSSQCTRFTLSIAPKWSLPAASATTAQFVVNGSPRKSSEVRFGAVGAFWKEVANPTAGPLQIKTRRSLYSPRYLPARSHHLSR